jgi:hypothetical protein
MHSFITLLIIVLFVSLGRVGFFERSVLICSWVMPVAVEKARAAAEAKLHAINSLPAALLFPCHARIL